MKYKYPQRNLKVLQAKGDIPYWVIAFKLSVHENTIRNWMKREMNPETEAKLLDAIETIKLELSAAH